jgi:hypothetical protein
MTINSKATCYQAKDLAAANSRFAKVGVLCFYESKVLNSSFVNLMKFNAEKTRLHKAATLISITN